MSDVYLRRIDAKGKAVITHHFVWSLPLFLASQQTQQRDLSAQGKDSVTIEVATREEYREFVWPKSKEKSR